MSAPPAPLPTAERIRAALERGLAPVGLAVEDESARHAGHAGAREGGHFRVHIVSERFRGLTRVARHRLVYDCLALAGGPGTLRAAGIHALAIEARTPEETK
jgi:BolA family transcriptional regulator, general stress-responsive regulator